jgi:hypothetical protein
MANEKRLMYADDFLDLFYVASAGQDKAFIKAVEMVEDTPTVDAVKVVRCKDCQYFVDTLPSGYGCSGFGGMTRACPNGFCSYGERKDNERKAD